MLDFNDIGKYHENNRIEAKKSQGGLPHSIWETYSAFANSFGGVILLGVIENADKSLSSVELCDPQSLVDEFWQLLDSGTASANILSNSDVSIVKSGEHQIVVIEVPRADSAVRPIYIGNDPYSGSYRRSGEGDYHCTRSEVNTMIRARAESSWDCAKVPALSTSALDSSTISRYRIALGEQTVKPSLLELHGDDFLEQILAACDGRPTYAGLLAFGKFSDIKSVFPAYDLAYYESGFILRAGIGQWSGNLFDFYLRVMERLHHRVQGTSLVSEALREALINAIIHASYFYGSGLTIEHHCDRIVISNPGSFRIDLNRALRDGITDARNRTLIAIFSAAGIGTGLGGGLRKISALWQSEDTPKPEITELLSPEETRFMLPLVKLSEREMRIVDYMTAHPKISSRELADFLQLGQSRTTQLLRSLIARGVVTAIGGGAARKYCLRA